MGRFEDLIEQARTGDTDALEALESEFSGSTLREKAEEADVLRKRLQEAVPLVRKARFEELAGKLDESIRDGLSVEDVNDMDPDSLTLEMLQDLGTTKNQQRQAQRLATAQDAGFDSVEDYETALEAVKQQRTTRTTGMESVAQGVASGSGDPSGGLEPTRYEKGKNAFEEAQKAGRTTDVAMAASVDAILADQFTGGEEA